MQGPVSQLPERTTTAPMSETTGSPSRTMVGAARVGHPLRQRPMLTPDLAQMLQRTAGNAAV